MGEIGILGAGLAGLLLAHAIKKRGGRCVLADTAAPNAASPMAPGIINPLAGRKYKANPVFENHSSRILQTFAEFEAKLNVQLWHPTKLIRLIEKEEQHAFLSSIETDWQGPILPPGSHGRAVIDPFGSFETKCAGWLDVPKLTSLAREQAAFTYIAAREIEHGCETIVDCRGWRCSTAPQWQNLPWKCARGEVGTVNLSDESLPRHIWNGGGWLQPLPDGSWRTGATYAWDHFEAPPQANARAELEKKLRRWLCLPFELQTAKVGIRPILQDFQPALGALPSHPHRHLFNALGSHGAIFGPPGADALADHLLSAAPLPPAWDIRRFH